MKVPEPDSAVSGVSRAKSARAWKTQKNFTGCPGSHRLMVLATGGPGDFVLKHFDEFYSLEWVPGPENREKPAKITKNEIFS